MTEHDPLVLRFDPQTVDHLGAKMYSHLPNALAELVANAYDADARKVVIRIEDDAVISISDDGHGMSREDIAAKYLRIGRNRRQDSPSGLTEGGGRLLVAADPDSLSGKARKARDYGIPIVGEAALARLTGAFPLR